MALLQMEKATAPSSNGDRFFLWAVVLLVMTAACFASWIGSFYVVMHPENPKCYRILKKFKKVDPPRRFQVTLAPKGDFFSPAKLLERYGKLGKLELARENAELLRAYVMNFKEGKKRVPYVAGRFQVVQSYNLGKADMFPSGVVAIAQAENLPQVLVEHVFPAAPSSVATIREVLATGTEFALERAHDLWALIHVMRHDDGRMQFTVVPLPYGGWQMKKSKGSFTLNSPEELLRDYKIDVNIGAGLPVIRDPQLAKSLADFKAFRRKLLANSGDDQAALAGPELVRFDATATETAPVQHAPVQPPALPRPVPTPAPSVPVPPRPAVITPRKPALIGVEPTPVPISKAPSVPAILAAADPHIPGRALSVSEASLLVENYAGEEPAVLSGDFVVTGVAGQRVALRTRESLRDPDADPTKPGSTAALIVVDYPEGVAPPKKDSSVVRDSARGFPIRDVIRDRNGQIMIVTAERERR